MNKKIQHLLECAAISGGNFAKLGEQYKILENSKAETPLKSYAFKREYCTPQGGIVLAHSAEEAKDLITFAYGYVANLKVYNITEGVK